MYVLSQCETGKFPFHFQLIPRFENDQSGNLYLLERELEESRWTVGKEAKDEKLTSGSNRVTQVEGLSISNRSKILEKRWVRSDEERKDFIIKLSEWAKPNLEM